MISCLWSLALPPLLPFLIGVIGFDDVLDEGVPDDIDVGAIVLDAVG
jgi:hypothetical protein